MIDNCNQTEVLTVPRSQSEQKLRIFVQLLNEWRTATNLISERKLCRRLDKTFADSAQLLELRPFCPSLGGPRLRGGLSRNGDRHSTRAASGRSCTLHRKR